MSDISIDQQSTTKGFAILSMAGIIGKVLSILYIPFLRKIIGEAGIGVYNIAYTIYVFLYVIANSGIPVAISKSISELIALGNYKDAVRAFKISRILLFIIGLVLSIGMFVFAEPLSKYMQDGKTTAKLAIMALAPTLLVTSILSTYRGYFQGRSNMTPTAISQVIEQLFNIIFSLFFAYIFYNKFGMEAGVAGGTVGTFVGALVAVIILILFYEKNKTIRVVKEHKVVKTRYSNKRLLRKILSYSVPMTVCVALLNIGALLDNKIITHVLPTLGISEHNVDVMVGLIYQYNTLINVPIAIISSLAVAVLPAISGYAALNDKRALGSKIIYAYRLCLLISIPSAVGLFSLSGGICKFLAYSENVAPLLRIGALNLILMGIVQIQTSVLQGVGRIRLVTVHAFMGVLCKVIAEIITMKYININAILLGNFICFGVQILLNCRAIKSTLKIKFHIAKKTMKIVFSSLVMGLVAFLMHYIIYSVFNMSLGTSYLFNAIATIVAIISAVYIYLYVLILTGGIRKKDFDVLPKTLIKLIPKFMLVDLI